MAPLMLLKTPTKNQLQPRKLSRIRAIIIHTTGATDLDKVCAYYGGSDEKVNPHYLINTTGLVRQFSDEDRIAYHCKLWPSERAVYEKGYGVWSRYKWQKPEAIETDAELPNYAQWKATFPTLRSPLELPTGGSPNANSIGIELLQPLPEQVTKGIFLDEQYEALALLLGDITHRLELPRDHRTILGHYDVSPLTRSDSKGGWDPGRDFDWLRVLSRLRNLL